MSDAMSLNDQLPIETAALPGGGNGTLRYCEVSSPDPNAMVLQVESWESDALGVAPAAAVRDVFHITIPLGLLSSSAFDLTAAVESAKQDAWKRLEALKRSRDKRSKIPKGEAVEGAQVTFVSNQRPQP